MTTLHIQASGHVNAGTELVLHTQDSGAIVLQVGSVQYTSPSCGAITLFFAPDGADLTRLRDAIDAHLTTLTGGAS